MFEVLSTLGRWYIYLNNNLFDLEWDKLSQNTFLAFYQRCPWFMPKILHSSNLCKQPSGNPE
jgi:hypothetical protein